jgi:hypothetical protein
MTKESMIKVLRYKSEHIKTKIKPKFFVEVANVLEQESCEDAVSRAEAVKVASGYCHPSNIAKELAKLPSVQPKYNASEWCHDCKEYDQDKHCCPRFNKVIRNTVEEIKELYIGTAEWVLLDECSNSGYYCSYCHKKLVKEGWSDTVKKIKYCPNCGCRMVKP